jgi:hypothetical protein
MCRLLNMEDVVDDIIDQLGLCDAGHESNTQDSSCGHGINFLRDSDGRGKISFEDFMRCRLQLAGDQRPKLEAVEERLQSQCNNALSEQMPLSIEIHTDHVIGWFYFFMVLRS